MVVSSLAGAAEEVVPKAITSAAVDAAAAASVSNGPHYVMEAALVTSTRAASSGVGTDVVSEIALRGGAAWSLTELGWGTLEVGAFGMINVGQDTGGTRAVRVAKTFFSVGGRGQLGYAMAGNRFGAMPFTFLEAGAGPGLSTAKVLAQVRYAPFLTHFARVGVGLQVRLWGVILTLDVGGGQKELRPVITSWLGVGWRL